MQPNENVSKDYNIRLRKRIFPKMADKRLEFKIHIR